MTPEPHSTRRAGPIGRKQPRGPTAASGQFDVVVAGAGPVGAALALMLARHWPDPSRIAVVDAQRRGDEPRSADDPRALALSQGSRGLLEPLGAWHPDANPITTIHVSQRGRLGRTLISHSDYGVPALGYVLPYRDVAGALAHALAACGVTIVAGRVAGALTHFADRVEFDAGDAVLSARVLVMADGGLFGAQQTRPVMRDYGQHAVVATVRAHRPRPGWAWERFTEAGPLALLPLRDPDGGRLALVWCCSPDQAAERAALSDGAFAAELHRAFGDRLGGFDALSTRHRFPLGLNARIEQVEGRVAHVGNAAQTLHPVAGQGLNLGLRDAADLTRALVQAARSPGADWISALAGFGRARRQDRRATIGLTDLMSQAFAHRFAPLQHALGLGLTWLDADPLARGMLARQMMLGQR